MIQKQQIIISYFRQGKSQREIAKTMRINRKTVRRYIEEYTQEKSLSNTNDLAVISPPTYDSSKRSKVKLTETVCHLIDQYLEANATKRGQGLAKQCMKVIDIHEALVEAGHQIGYTTVCGYVKQQRHKGQEVYIRQTYLPGSSAEFDWGMVKLVIGGKQKNMMLAVFTLAYSNHRWAMLFYRQDMSSMLEAHVKYLEQIQRVPQEIVYDNMKTAVAKFTVKASDKVPTDDLLKISSYYQFNYRFCNAAKGNEKGHVERSVEYIRRKAFSRVNEFDTLESAQKHLNQVLIKLNNKQVRGQKQSIIEQFKTEQSAMLELPVSTYDYALTQTARVDKYHTITIDTNHYSIPEQINTPVVQYKCYPTQIMIYDRSGQVVSIHQRLHDKYQWCIHLDHYWQSFYKKPGALAGSQALEQAPKAFKYLFEQYYKDCPQVFIQLCLFCKDENYAIQYLLEASEKTFRMLPHAALTFDRVKWNMVQLIREQQVYKDDASTTVQVDSMSDLIAQHCEKQLQDIQSFI